VYAGRANQPAAPSPAKNLLLIPPCLNCSLPQSFRTRENRKNQAPIRKLPLVSAMSVSADHITEISVGKEFGVQAEVRLGELKPDDVRVELFVGVVDANGETREGQRIPVEMEKFVKLGPSVYRAHAVTCTGGGNDHPPDCRRAQRSSRPRHSPSRHQTREYPCGGFKANSLFCVRMEF
jgi:hypothetical protein